MFPTKFRQLTYCSEEAKTDFQDGLHDGRFGFPSGTILIVLDLQVTPMLPTKFQVNWLFDSGEEAKKKKKKKKKKRNIVFKMAAMATILKFRSKRF